MKPLCRKPSALDFLNNARKTLTLPYFCCHSYPLEFPAALTKQRKKSHTLLWHPGAFAKRGWQPRRPVSCRFRGLAKNYGPSRPLRGPLASPCDWNAHGIQPRRGKSPRWGDTPFAPLSRGTGASMCREAAIFTGGSPPRWHSARKHRRLPAWAGAPAALPHLRWG